MKKRSSLADRIANGIADAMKRQTWFSSLPSEAQTELAEVHQRFRSGRYGSAKRLTVAKLILSHCEERGWKTCDTRRLAEWLQKDL